jgi:hypothetical protein
MPNIGVFYNPLYQGDHMIKALPILFIILLAACSQVDSSRNASAAKMPVAVSGIDSKTVLNKAGEYSVRVSGVKNDVTIKAGNTVTQLLVSGVDNNITVEETAVVQSISLSGSNNKVYVSAGFQAKTMYSGSKNAIIEKQK